MPAIKELITEPLTAAGFAPFGEVVEARAGAAFETINDGNCRRYNDLARARRRGGASALSIFCAEPRKPPFAVEVLERHPLGTQAFMPLGRASYYVVVAPPAPAKDEPHWRQTRVFAARGGQGVNFFAGVWHHPLFVVGGSGRFLVVDRVGKGDNCQVCRAPARLRLRIGAGKK